MLPTLRGVSLHPAPDQCSDLAVAGQTIKKVYSVLLLNDLFELLKTLSFFSLL